MITFLFGVYISTPFVPFRIKLWTEVRDRIGISLLPLNSTRTVVFDTEGYLSCIVRRLSFAQFTMVGSSCLGTEHASLLDADFLRPD